MRYGLSIIFCLLLGMAGGPLKGETSASAEEWIRDGVLRHKAGEYEAALEAYQKALSLEPQSAVALYEMALTYSVMEDHQSCIETMEKLFKGDVSDRLVGPGYTVLASCHSASGKPKRALRVFRKGLEKAPEDFGLHFNIAVTLAGESRDGEAIDHLETAIRLAPRYASAYWILAELYRRGGQRVPSLMLYSRFFALEHGTGRSVVAAQRIWTLLEWGITEKGNGDMSISLALDGGSSSPYGAHEMSLSLAAAAMSLGEAEGQTEAQKRVHALTRFWKIMGEMGPPDGQEDTAMWTAAVHPLMGLEATEAHWETLAYLMAHRAKLEGAEDWLRGHPQEIAQLEKLLSTP